MNYQLRTGRQIEIALCLLAATVAFGSSGFSQEVPDAEKKNAEERDPVYQEERDLMKRTVVKVFDAEAQPRDAIWLDHAIFRYGDETMRIENSSIWVWHDQGRPVAIQKIEVNKYWNPPGWTYCFSALSESLVEVKWPNVRQAYKSREPVEFREIPDAPKPGPKPTWKLQTRKLAESFTATMGGGKATVQLRTLARPIHEYESAAHGILAGAIFSLATGTNPSMFLIVELRDNGGQPQWVYGSARATNAPIKLMHGDTEVRSEGAAPQPGHFPTWTYTWMARSSQLNEKTE